jgi:hypothetical protein
LLIDARPENIARVRAALQILEDKAVNDVADDDVARYSVVRVADVRTRSFGRRTPSARPMPPTGSSCRHSSTSLDAKRGNVPE